MAGAAGRDPDSVFYLAAVQPVVGAAAAAAFDAHGWPGSPARRREGRCPHQARVHVRGPFIGLDLATSVVRFARHPPRQDGNIAIHPDSGLLDKFHRRVRQLANWKIYYEISEALRSLPHSRGRGTHPVAPSMTLAFDWSLKMYQLHGESLSHPRSGRMGGIPSRVQKNSITIGE